MATPDKANVRVAELLQSLVQLLQEGLLEVANLDGICSRAHVCQFITDPIRKEVERLKISLNKAFGQTRRIGDIIRADSQTANEAFLCSEAANGGEYDIKNISKDTSPRTRAKAGSLVARVGHEECLSRLKQVGVKDRGNRIVYTGAACQCFGFTGTGHNFLSVWAALREFGTNLPLRTYGILRFDQINKGYKWDELFDFANAYYLNYHRQLCMHLFGYHGLYVKRKQGDWFLASDFDQKA